MIIEISSRLAENSCSGQNIAVMVENFVGNEREQRRARHKSKQDEKIRKRKITLEKRFLDRFK